jgi:SprT protein
MQKERLNILLKYLPAGTSDQVMKWLEAYPVQIRISNGRTSKMGDFRPPQRVAYNRISVNHDLHPYAFLITLVHEIAHMMVWSQYKNKVHPHGKEWKAQFRELMEPFLENGVFPAELKVALRDYFIRPAASSSSHLQLSRILHQYNNNSDAVLLESLPHDTVFRAPNGKHFMKKEKIRKRYRCICLENKRVYLFSPITPVLTEREH